MALTDLFHDIADAIREKDGSTDTIVANTFPERIRAISSGSSPTTPLDPVEVYNSTRPADWLMMPTPNDNEMYLLFHIPDGVSSLLAFTVTCTGSYTVALGTAGIDQFVQQSAVSVASGTKFEAELNAANYGNLTSDGFKQVMVKVSGTDILTWKPSSHSKKPLPANFSSWNIVEIVCKLPSGTKVMAGGPTSAEEAIKSLRYFTWIGQNNVTDMSGMFKYCYSLTAIPGLNTANVTGMSGMFNGCYRLTAIPDLNTANVTDMSDMFNSCYSLTAIPGLNTGNVANMSRMFYNCRSLTAIPGLNTEDVTDMSSMFSGCNSLTEIPDLNTANVTNMSSMFNGCNSLTTISGLNTANVTNMSSIFNGCNSLTTIPSLNTAKVTNMSSMFNGCSSLTAIPSLNTANVTNMGSMFNGCLSLAAIPDLNTAKVTSMSSMFNGCRSLTAIPDLNTAHVTNMSSMFNSCFSLTSIRLDPTVTGWSGYAISLPSCSLGHQALVDLFNSLPTITSAKALTLTGNPGASELTDAEKAIATGKNWTLKL